eukprot:gnl/TRDRNA2_/TRDRNA2_192802_c0_seq1.p1 gnl/TRDRNA2_/TRDRNA2_192802_c0~~gnl/TRDRNA2_/TRDRNA2_192802_c0_seq1.p1  ORF type:complete len:431 (-),score=66.84 gnl/TRDRNA2_/TRDRNA2_192802_c0_seq1:46-1338(-)
MDARLVFLLLVHLFAPILVVASEPAAELKAALQALLDAATKPTWKPSVNFSLQLTWKSEGVEFTVSSSTPGSRIATQEDTWLFGSGTKPFTATQIMQAHEKGRLDLNATVSHYLDPMLKSKTGKTFVDMFGPNATNMTVWHLVSMQSGIPDFDVPEFDAKVLSSAFNRTWTPLDFIEYAATQAWVGLPGEVVFYSSTNYVVLGFVLLAIEGKGCDDWPTLDQWSIAPSDCSDLHFVDAAPMSTILTVPGISAGGVGLSLEGRPTSPATRIFKQGGGILGYTCGNLVTTTTDMARFMYDLIYKKTLVSEDTLALMAQTRDFSSGWGKPYIRYGAGLFVQQADFHKMRGPWKYGDWGTTLGHGGDTYGFISDQGFIPQLNATFSHIVNTDRPPSQVFPLTCEIIKTAGKILLGSAPPLDCGFGDAEEATILI